MKIKQIVFDLGGVLIDWNPRYFFEKEIKDKEFLDYLLTEVTNMEWHSKQDEGRTFAEATEILVEQYPEHEKYIRMFYDSWDQMFGGVFHDTLAIFHQIRKVYPLYSITNWPAEAFPRAKERFEFLSHFKGIVVSGEEKIAKPNPLIYERFLKRYNLKAEECLFIDDKEENVISAQKIGFNGIHFIDSKQLEEELQRLRIIK